MSFSQPSDATQISLFPELTNPTKQEDLLSPESYTGLAGFHKYWGKKPTESLSYLIENLTTEKDIVMDPFLGSGLISREALERKRRFVGVDINPFSIEHTTFLLDLPASKDYYKALVEIEEKVAARINATYKTTDGRPASHYLWEGGNIESVWIKPETGRTRIEICPSEFDLKAFEEYKNYIPRNFRNLTFFTNSRINVKPTMSVNDIFTGRAMYNIDLLIDAISAYSGSTKRALLLTLTSAAGQMSNMVFAIKNRSKNSKRNTEENKVEVGSWVIGYWIPETHFEINVWNCFKNRAGKLLKALPDYSTLNYSISKDPTKVDCNGYDAWIINQDCRTALKKIPSETITFICTDPPHSDRVPYLELSEMWNSLLGFNVDFENEIVVSNAKERKKSKALYNNEMTEFFLESSRILKKDGFIALYFNARDEESWQYLKSIEATSGTLKFLGCFPMVYSATSVVQDNRKGAMKSDYIIIYRKVDKENCIIPDFFKTIAGWSTTFPDKE